MAKPSLKRTRTAYGGASVISQRTKRSRTNNTLGNLGGARVAASASTLSKASGPFSAKKYVTMVYEDAMKSVSNGTALLTAFTKPNSLFDYDHSGYFGNKQPLYFDSLLSVSGPYKNYKVTSWKTTYTIVNTTAVPMNVFALPPIAGTGEMDSVAEADNWPGVKKLYLSQAGGSKDTASITVTGHINDVYATFTSDSGLVGAYSSDPATLIYSGIMFASADGTTAVSAYVAVKHEAFAELTFVDALVS